MLFCQGFFFRHLLLPPCTVPCKSPDDLDTCPNHFNLCFFRGHEIIIGHNCLPDSVSDSIVSDLISVRDAKQFPKVSHLSGLQFLLTARQANTRKRVSFQKEENFNVDKNLRTVGEAGNIAENEQDVKFRIVWKMGKKMKKSEKRKENMKIIITIEGEFVSVPVSLFVLDELLIRVRSSLQNLLPQKRLVYRY